MPRGDKSSYTDKQKRQADHIRIGCLRFEPACSREGKQRTLN
jgi:hypothetical protein